MQAGQAARGDTHLSPSLHTRAMPSGVQPILPASPRTITGSPRPHSICISLQQQRQRRRQGQGKCKTQALVRQPAGGFPDLTCRGARKHR